MDYSKLNDNELIIQAKEKNEVAINMLYEKYNPLITKKCSSYFKYVKDKGIDFNDLKQECLIGFEESIQSYSQDNKALFYTFTSLCMDRQIITFIKKVNRNKNKVLNEAISIEGSNDKEISLINQIEDNTFNPEIGFMSLVEYEELYEKIIKVLTNFEECVFNLKLQNFDYKEISNILDKEPKSVYNAIQRIKEKIKGIKEYKL